MHRTARTASPLSVTLPLAEDESALLVAIQIVELLVETHRAEVIDVDVDGGKSGSITLAIPVPAGETEPVVGSGV